MDNKTDWGASESRDLASVLEEIETYEVEHELTTNEELRVAYQALSRGIIYADTQQALYTIISNNVKQLNERFEFDGARLLINTTFNFAYLTTLKTEAGESLPNLLRTLRLNKYDSYLWIFLRSEFDKAMRLSGEAIIKESEIIAQLDQIEPSSVQDKRKHDRAMSSAITKSIDNGVLKKLKLMKNDEQRYLIRPLISVVIGAEQVDTFLSQFSNPKSDSVGGDSNA
ncbi:hypothetical protein JCM19241_5030 [Vibrio ishigakensis]|uniref:DUF4194 domain-containing protein n=1 Tax=Vibrio ishigakensis TaxID=1481914 RepID=A0A0B8QGT9_9VIBR|nr:hypothetical protein JCM19241_5030 [Vibrio ishigakensis]